jgi:hypothetical protein
MNSIELTQEHKSKLLEMCNKLFSEYDDILFSPITFNMLMFNGTEKDTVYIHWFEFCITHLAKKVCKSDGITLTFNGYKNNPIDFLYKEFKKLK